MASKQLSLSGDEVETERQRPDTFVVCAETGAFILRSRRHDWPHETLSLEAWFDGDDEADESPYDEYDADDEVGQWFDITLSYSVDYRFRVPAFSEHEAKEVAKDWQLDATPADKHHVHTRTRKGDSIKRQELPDDWDPYGGERIHEVMTDGD